MGSTVTQPGHLVARGKSSIWLRIADLLMPKPRPSPAGAQSPPAGVRRTDADIHA